MRRRTAQNLLKTGGSGKQEAKKMNTECTLFMSGLASKLSSLKSVNSYPPCAYDGQVMRSMVEDMVPKEIAQSYIWFVSENETDFEEFLAKKICPFLTKLGPPSPPLIVHMICNSSQDSGVFENQNPHWTTLVLDFHSQKLFYKDDPPPAFIFSVLKKSLPAHKFETVSHPQDHRGQLNLLANQKNNFDDGPLTLINFEVISKTILSCLLNGSADGFQNDFVEIVKNIKFCEDPHQLTAGVQQMRDEVKNKLGRDFRTDLKIGFNKLSSSSNLEQFQLAIKNFVDQCLPYLDAFPEVNTYEKILREELGRADRDPEYEINVRKLTQAKLAMLSKCPVKFDNEGVAMAGTSENVENLNSRRENYIPLAEMGLQTFPWQTQLFQVTFGFLALAQSDEERAKIIEQVSQRFGLEPEQIQSFFDLQTQTEMGDAHLQFPDPVSLSDDPDTDNTDEAESWWFENLRNFFTKPKPTNLKNWENESKRNDNGEKNFDEVLREFVSENKNFANAQIVVTDLRNKYVQMQTHYNDTWRYAGEEEIRMWAAAQKKRSILVENMSLPEMLAIMDRVNELVTEGHRLRAPQILTLFLFLQNETKDYAEVKSQGKLCQVQTGEGKTTIIAMLAAISSLCGAKFVDVITSNPVLAHEAVTEKRKFYQILGLTAATNNPDDFSGKKITPKLKKSESCYRADILFGCIGNFQFDYLRDTFEGSGIRKGRQFGTLIIDEVDSMLIDSGGHLAKLAVPFPGMESLQYCYVNIWQALCASEAKRVQSLSQAISDQLFELAPKEILQNSFTPSTADLQQQIVDDILATNPLDVPLIPCHLKCFAKKFCKRWIENALHAKYSCHKNHHYTLRSPDKPASKDGHRQGQQHNKNEVVPIDFAHTGVTLQNTIWSHALHQFVQLKHNLNLTSESLSSAAISNYGYINLYRGQGGPLFGLTGTLGSEPEQELLANLYDVSFHWIPTFKTKKFEELKGRVVAGGDSQWAAAVAVETELMVRSECRSVLIISQTIADSLLIERALRLLETMPWADGDPNEEAPKFSFQIRKYFDERDADVAKEVVDCGQIILATNIAGRGTDFRTTPDLEEMGGLHVCPTFCPANERVKFQAIFRTARQGNRGSAKIIMRESELLNLGLQFPAKDNEVMVNFNQINDRVASLEYARIEEIKAKKVGELYLQDKLFAMFSQLCRETKSKLLTQNGPSSLHIFVMRDLKEFWSFWLESQDNLSSTASQNLTYTELYKELDVRAAKLFSNFKHLAQNILDGQICHNPYYAIQHAEELLAINKMDEAETILMHAISMSSVSYANDTKECDGGVAEKIENYGVLCAANIKLFDIAMHRGGVLMNRLKDALAKVLIIGYKISFKDEKYKETAIEFLEEAQRALGVEINFLNKNIENNSDSKNNDDNGCATIFFQNFQSRLLSLSIHDKNLTELLTQLRESENAGLCIGSRVPSYFKNLKVPATTAIKKEEKDLRDFIRDSTIHDLKMVGLDITYALQKVPDVPPYILKMAHGQIAGGVALYGTSLLFPLVSPVAVPLAGTMISEGILDIALNLLACCYGDSGEEYRKAYLKTKLISYTVSLLTIGFNTILTYTNIVEKAAKGCQKLAGLLRSSPVMKSLCEFIATKLEQIGVYLSRLAEIAKLAKLSQVKEVAEAMPSLSSVFVKSGKTAAVKAVESALFEKAAVNVVSGILSFVQPLLIGPLVLMAFRNEFDSADSKKHLMLLEAAEIMKVTRTLVQTLNLVAIHFPNDLLVNVTREWVEGLKKFVKDSVIPAGKILMIALEFLTKFKKDVELAAEGREVELQDERSIDEILEHVAAVVGEAIYHLVIRFVGGNVNMVLFRKITERLSV